MTEYQRVENLTTQVGFKSYQDYLRSQHWRELKERSGVMRLPCCVCDKPSEVAHHMRYRNLLDVLPEDLVGMCFECHDDFHMACRKAKQSYIGLPPLQILTITTAFRSTPWAARWKARKAKKRLRQAKASLPLTKKQHVSRMLKSFRKGRKDEQTIKQLAAWLLDFCCNKNLVEWKTLPSLKGNG